MVECEEKMLYLLVETEYRRYPWCQKILNGINDETRKKRINIIEISGLEWVKKDDEKAVILLVGATSVWIKKYATEALAYRINSIVLSNQPQTMLSLPCSLVSVDIPESMQRAVSYLNAAGKTRLALYGVNPKSTSDPWRANAFRSIVGGERNIYETNGSLEITFKKFWENIKSYDGVICANDYSAISLIRNLKVVHYDNLEKLYILSYNNTYIAKKFNPSIPSFSDNYEKFGRAALYIYDILQKDNYISSVNIMIQAQLHVRESTDNFIYKPETKVYIPSVDKADNRFFQEKEIAKMASIEIMLSQSDETNMAILYGLLNNDTYAKIGEDCFISETAAKYRVKRMMDTCNVKSRKELVELLKEYF